MVLVVQFCYINTVAQDACVPLWVLAAQQKKILYCLQNVQTHHIGLLFRKIRAALAIYQLPPPTQLLIHGYTSVPIVKLP